MWYAAFQQRRSSWLLGIKPHHSSSDSTSAVLQPPCCAPSSTRCALQQGSPARSPLCRRLWNTLGRFRLCTRSHYSANIVVRGRSEFSDAHPGILSVPAELWCLSRRCSSRRCTRSLDSSASVWEVIFGITDFNAWRPTCSRGPKLHSGRGAGRDRTNSMQRSPKGAKMWSFLDTAIGKQSGCLKFGGMIVPSWQQVMPLPPCPKKHLPYGHFRGVHIPMSYSPLVMGVCVRSWSKNCPHCITRRVRFSCGVSVSVAKTLLTSLALGSSWPFSALLRGAFTPGRYQRFDRLIHERHAQMTILTVFVFRR